MRTINWYLERIEVPGGTTQAALYPTPGVTTLATGTSNPGRAHFFEDDREFAVIGTIFYEIDTFGALTNRGTVALDSNPATISSNGDGGGQLFITSGSNGYNFNLSTNTLSQIAALNGKATMGDHLDGYFLACDPVRRAHLRARSRARRRGARRHARARERGHDDDGRHARDGVRQGGGRPRRLHRPRADRRGRTRARAPHQSTSRAHAGLPVARDPSAV